MQIGVMAMLKEDFKARPLNAVSTETEAKTAYAAPEVFPVASAKVLIQGRMIHEYWDCIGNGKTLSRPDC